MPKTLMQELLESSNNEQYEVHVEFSVAEYHAEWFSVTGTVEEIIPAILAAQNKFYKEVYKSLEENSDLRDYTRPNANGYPGSPGSLEWGEDIDCSLNNVEKIVTVKKELEVSDPIWKKIETATAVV